MKCLPHTRGVYNKAPFLTVGGSLFSVPGSSHRADQFHDERTDAACRRSHASKYGQSPGAFVLRRFKCRNTDILPGDAFAVILELRNHDVVKALVGARDFGLEPGSSAFTSPISRTSCTSSLIAPPQRP